MTGWYINERNKDVEKKTGILYNDTIDQVKRKGM